MTRPFRFPDPGSRFGAVAPAILVALATVTLATVAATAASAAEPSRTQTAPDGTPATQAAGSGRWQIVPAEGGVYKLDTETGRMSFCRGAEGAPACRLVPDDRVDLEGERDRLRRERDQAAAERDRLAGALGRTDGGGILGPEDQARIDRALGAAGDAIRRFKGFVEELKRDWNGEEPAPDRV